MDTAQLKSLVHRALEGDAEALRGIVHAFQDMAVGYAYALLGDFHLAEDAAQEAFIEACRHLSNLREPAAFPGWFRKIMFKQCDRLRRGKAARIVSLASAGDLAGPAPAPPLVAEQLELTELVLGTVRALPENERIAIILFYMGAYSQRNVGQFLRLPLTNVKRLLQGARRRLKKRMAAIVGHSFRGMRPSQDSRFADRVASRLRPLIEKDWHTVAAIHAVLAPTDRDGIAAWLNNRQQFDAARFVRRHHVAEAPETHAVLGYGALEQGAEPRVFRLFLVCCPELLRRGVGDQLYERLTADLNQLNAACVWLRVATDEKDTIAFLLERGFGETTRFSEWHLSLADVDLSPFSGILDQLANRGIVITTLAQEREREPACLHKLYELRNELITEESRDVPRISFAAHVQRLQGPHICPNGYFIARHDARYVGVSTLNPSEAPNPEGLLGRTDVLCSYRGRRIGTALTVAAIDFAQRHAHQRITVFVNPVHASASALCRRLGFRCRLEMVVLAMTPQGGTCASAVHGS